MDKPYRNADGPRPMSDVAMARDYVREIGDSTQRKVAVNATLKWLTKLFPHRGEPKNQWTERRVQSFWNEEAALVQFREMVELHRAAEAARAERAKKEARKKHAAYREETARLAAVALLRTSGRDSRMAP